MASRLREVWFHRSAVVRVCASRSARLALRRGVAGGPPRGLAASARASILRLLDSHAGGGGLAGRFYTDSDIFHADLEAIFHREWVFAGTEAELTSAGSWLTLQVGAYPVVVVRGAQGEVRAFHNVCRHRGFKLCSGASGKANGTRLVCQYHRWAYDFEGKLTHSRDSDPGFDPSSYGLKSVHAESVEGHIFVSVAPKPCSIAPIRAMLGPCIEPFDLTRAKVAFVSRVIERANWKLVWENNRECYHCRGSHPELSRTFPDDSTHSTGILGAEGDDKLRRCEALGLPSQFQQASNNQYRIMRMFLLEGARSMTMSGEPAVRKRFGELPEDEDIGDLLFFHFPTTWNHFTADHALTFRVLPISPTETEVVTKWLVPREAVEGVDYDLQKLTEVWLATNATDQEIVERVQEGVSSPSFEPGPYNRTHEPGVVEFIDWYRNTLEEHLRTTGVED